MKVLAPLQEAPTSEVRWNHRTILHTAVEQSWYDVVPYLATVELCNSTDAHGDTPLHLACRIGNLKIVKLLVSGSVPDSINSKGDTAAHVAFDEGNTDIVKLTTGGTIPSHISSCPCCMENTGGDTPLHIACKYNNIEAACVLVKTCIRSLAIQNASGNTPLHIACQNYYPKLIETLATTNSCNMDCQNRNGKTPLYVAFETDRSYHTRWAPISYSEWSGGSPTQLLLPYCNLSVTDTEGNTILHLACRYKHRNTVELLALQPQYDTIVHGTICQSISVR